MKTTRCTNENLVKRLLWHIFFVWVRFLLFFSSVNENGKVLYSRFLVSKMWNAKLQTENLENLKTVNGRRQTAVEMKISMLAGVWGKQESKKTPDPLADLYSVFISSKIFRKLFLKYLEHAIESILSTHTQTHIHKNKMKTETRQFFSVI